MKFAKPGNSVLVQPCTYLPAADHLHAHLADALPLRGQVPPQVHALGIVRAGAVVLAGALAVVLVPQVHHPLLLHELLDRKKGENELKLATRKFHYENDTFSFCSATALAVLYAFRTERQV